MKRALSRLRTSEISPAMTHAALPIGVAQQARATPDSEAQFESFVVAHQDRALRVALRMLSGDRAGAEDVVQDALVRAHGALGKFRGESQLSTWFERILIREVYRYLRSPWCRWFGGQSPAELPSASAWPNAEPWLAPRIEAALARLSTHQRAAFVLVHLEGYTVEETSELMGRAPGTIKSHLHRALKRLRSDLADFRPESHANPSSDQDSTHEASS